MLQTNPASEISQLEETLSGLQSARKDAYGDYRKQLNTQIENVKAEIKKKKKQPGAVVSMNTNTNPAESRKRVSNGF